MVALSYVKPKEQKSHSFAVRNFNSLGGGIFRVLLSIEVG
jgi:hypothetical protein